MKKYFLFTMLTLILANVFAKPIEPISRFIDSKAFGRFILSSKFAIDVEPNFEKAKVVKRTIDSKVIDVVCLPLENESGVIKGYIEAIELKKEKGIKLPNNDDFFMMYRDFSNFDLAKQTGTINVYDLNYDETLFARMSKNTKGEFSKETFLVPKEILEKYKALSESNKKVLAEMKVNSIPCDTNGNGNLGFMECYRCFNQVCQGDDECFFLCYFVGDALGWVVTGAGPLCQYTIATSCAILAAIY